MRQYAGYATAEETNKRFKYLLSQGQTRLSVAFDLPTQLGYDSDRPLAEGKVGVAVSSLPDMEVLLEGLPLDRISTSMTINLRERLRPQSEAARAGIESFLSALQRKGNEQGEE